jgi:tight adherence protein B
MSMVVGALVVVGILMWPEGFTRQRLRVLPAASSASARQTVTGSPWVSAKRHARRLLPGRPASDVTAQDLLGLLQTIAPALEAGIAPAPALRFAVEARSGSAHDPLGALVGRVASAAGQGARLGPLWGEAARSEGSPELGVLAQAWSLTEEMGVPLAQAVRTTAGLLQARIAHERRLAGAVAGAKATVNLLTILPTAGPVLALVLGIGPGALYGGSGLTQMSLALGLGLAGVGRWWVNRMVRSVARGPVVT